MPKRPWAGAAGCGLEGGARVSVGVTVAEAVGARVTGTVGVTVRVSVGTERAKPKPPATAGTPAVGEAVSAAEVAVRKFEAAV